MNQSTWEKRNTEQTINIICPSCSNHIVHHSRYHDERFCEECYNFIVADYEKKKQDPDEQEHLAHIGAYSANKFLQSVYEELTS